MGINPASLHGSRSPFPHQTNSCFSPFKRLLVGFFYFKYCAPFLLGPKDPLLFMADSLFKVRFSPEIYCKKNRYRYER